MRSEMFLCALLLGAALGVAPSVAQAQGRQGLPIGYVSVQRILTEADDAKVATKELEALRAARTQDLNAKRQVLDATRLQLANAGGYFSGTKRAQLQDAVRKQEVELQQATQQAQTDLQELQRKVQDRLRGELNTILTKLVAERGLLYVLNQDAALVLAPTGANLTDDVLARMNAAAAQREANAKAAAEVVKK